MSEKKDISVIIPVFNEEASLVELSEWLVHVLDRANYSYEVVFIDDGSDDRSWETILSIAKDNKDIKGIRFNKNYGKSAALHTGFKCAKGEVVVTMDADLQDSPDEIPVLYKMIFEEDYDLVSGWKKKRHDPPNKKIPSRFFNYVTGKISGIKLHDFNCGLKAYKAEVVKHISVYGEMHRYIPVIAKWKGFDKIGEKVVTHYPRKHGRTKYGMERFVFGFLDLLSILFITKFKKRPMHFFGSFGILSFALGFIIVIWIIAHKLYNISQNLPARDVVDQPLFFLALVALIVGIQLFLAGYLAELISSESKEKTDCILAEKINI